MSYFVAKTFKTINRKFEVIGRPIRESDVDGAVPFDVWVKRGFIEDRSQKPIQSTLPNKSKNNEDKETLVFGKK